MSNGLPDWLPGYLAERDRQRRAEADEALERLTTQERGLVRETASAAFVHGRMFGSSHGFANDDVAHPKDSVVVQMVMQTALSMSDLYPLLSGSGQENDDA